MVFRVPSYYKNFRCIADKCPDNCCRGWEIDIDEDTLDYYKDLKGPMAEKPCVDQRGWKFCIE